MNLTETSIWFKRFAIVLAILVALYYLINYVIIPAATNVITGFIPQRDPPTLSYGILPPLEFYNKSITGSPRYELNTESGNLPNNLPSKELVYRIVQNPYSFDAGKDAQNNANSFGFSDQDLITDLRGNIYQWRNLLTGVQLEINLENRYIKINSDLNNRSSDFITGYYADRQAANISREKLVEVQRFDSLYESGSTVIIAGRYLNERLILEQDFSRAHLYRVDFFRSIDNYPIYGPDAKKGLINLFVGRDYYQTSTNEASSLNFPYAEIYYNEIVQNSNATYPLTPISTAWNEVVNGRGIISSVTPRGYNPFAEYSPVEIRDILINDIYIAYYENTSGQEYLQPIYVFEGNYRTSGTQGGDIVIYYPAIQGQYIQSIEGLEQ